MVHQPLVSVLMTAYNREKYIAEAIKSVIASSYKNFELIIVDDCSSDNTVAVAQQFEKADERVKVYVNKTNLGDYNNRNNAVGFAKGEYLKFFDSDDVLYKYSLEIFLSALALFHDAAYAFTDGQLQDNRAPYPIKINSHQAFREHYFNGGLFFSGPGGLLIRKSCFMEVGGFSGKNLIGDQELCMKLASLYPIVKVQPGLLWWRVHEEQEFKKGKKQSQYLIMRYLINSENIMSSPLLERERVEALQNLKILLARNIIFMYIVKLNFKMSLNILKQTNLKWHELKLALRRVKSYKDLIKG